MDKRNLHFFDKDGYNLNFDWNDRNNYWEGTIFLPRVSVGLYANTTIYVMENMLIKINDISIDKAYTESYKVLYNSSYYEINCHSNDENTIYYINVDGDEIEINSEVNFYKSIYTFPQGDGKITFSWDSLNKFVDEFFMFNFDNNYTPKETSALKYTPNDGPDCETLLINRFDKYDVKLDTTQSINPLPIHIAFTANEKYNATTYSRTLIMKYENKTVARIRFIAETIEEDERLKIWNSNLGYNITPEDTIIFNKSDIKEYKPDYQLLNEKRKELMLEGHNIYPYIGSYKAIVNAIKFFGYDNLNIIEFWKNVNPDDENFGKIYHSSKYSLTKKEILTIGARNIQLPNKDYKKINKLALVYSINKPTGEVDVWELPKMKEEFSYTIEEALIKLFALRKKLNKEFMPGTSKIIDIIGEANYFGIQGLKKVGLDKYSFNFESNFKPSFNISEKYIHIDGEDYTAKVKLENSTFEKYNPKWTIKMSSNQIDEELKNAGIEKIYEERSLDDTISNALGETPEFKLPYIGYYDITMEIDNVKHTVKKCIKVEPYNLEIKGFYYDVRDLPKEIRYKKSEDMEKFILEKLEEITEDARYKHSENDDINQTMPKNDGTDGPYIGKNIDKEWYLLNNISYKISSLLPDKDSSRYIRNGVDIKPYTWFLLGFEKDKIKVKGNPKWTLINTSTNKSIEYNGDYFTYMVKDVGNYTIKLELEDINGNHYSSSRNIIVVNDNSNYKLYQTFKKEYDEYIIEKTLKELKNS